MKHFKELREAALPSDTFRTQDVDDQAPQRLITDTELGESAVGERHHYGVELSMPDHPMVSKRGETYYRRIALPAEADSQKRAEQHYRKRGFKVHQIWRIQNDGALGEATLAVDEASPPTADSWASTAIHRDAKAMSDRADTFSSAKKVDHVNAAIAHDNAAAAHWVAYRRAKASDLPRQAEHHLAMRSHHRNSANYHFKALEGGVNEATVTEASKGWTANAIAYHKPYAPRPCPFEKAGWKLYGVKVDHSKGSTLHRYWGTSPEHAVRRAKANFKNDPLKATAFTYVKEDVNPTENFVNDSDFDKYKGKGVGDLLAMGTDPKPEDDPKAKKESVEESSASFVKGANGNLDQRIIRHQELAKKANARGDTYRQKYHLAMVDRLKKESIHESEEFQQNPDEPEPEANTFNTNDAAGTVGSEAPVEESRWPVTKHLNTAKSFAARADVSKASADATVQNGFTPRVTEAIDEPDADETKQDQRLTILVRLGLADQSKLTILKRGMQKLEDGRVSQILPNERAVLFTLLADLTSLVTGDDSVFNKVRAAVTG